jgi:hypothetical protein
LAGISGWECDDISAEQQQEGSQSHDRRKGVGRRTRNSDISGWQLRRSKGEGARGCDGRETAKGSLGFAQLLDPAGAGRAGGEMPTDLLEPAWRQRSVDVGGQIGRRNRVTVQPAQKLPH